LKAIIMFIRRIGIDYSGAETPTSSLKGLRVYLAEGEAPPVEVPIAPANGPDQRVAHTLEVKSCSCSGPKGRIGAPLYKAKPGRT
jgi:hypothetical protein